LLAAGADVNTIYTITVPTGKQQAVLFELLLKLVDDPNWKVARLLLDKGAKYGLTGLPCNSFDITVVYDEPEAVRLLLQQGADVHALSVHNNTPWLLAATRKTPEIAALLLNRLNKTDIYVTNADGDTALHIAVSHSATQTVQYLLKLGLEVTARNNSNLIPVQLAETAKIAALFLPYKEQVAQYIDLRLLESALYARNAKLVEIVFALAPPNHFKNIGSRLTRLWNKSENEVNEEKIVDFLLVTGALYKDLHTKKMPGAAQWLQKLVREAEKKYANNNNNSSTTRINWLQKAKAFMSKKGKEPATEENNSQDTKRKRPDKT
jgi:ankyrin repeat protein